MTDHHMPLSRRPRMRTALAALAVIAAVAAGVVLLSRDEATTAASAQTSDDTAPGTTTAAPADDGTGATTAEGQTSAPATSSATATASVEIRDLVETARLSGSLGYDEPITVINRLEGTVTVAARAGVSTVRGDELFRIDGRPVLALYGESGAWRPLGPGITSGIDVRQLEENLSALGHDPDERLTLDDRWDSATTVAVKRWQTELGLEADGRLALGQVVFLPGPGRITAVELVRGQGVGDGVAALRYQSGADVDQVVGHREGNVTELAPVGAVVAAGDLLHAVNTNPTWALIADHVTNDRTLRKGVADGADIEALERNLVDLGYDPEGQVTVDRAWDDDTTDAVNRWLAALDQTENGRTTPELFQFVEPDSSVLAHVVEVGDELDGEAALLDVGRSLRRVTAAVATSDQDLVAVGDSVEIVLPDGASTPGVISEVATVARENAAGDSEIELEVEPGDPAGLGSLTEAPVKVKIERRRTDAALAVPSASLVGLVGGGHAVEVVLADGTTQLVAVELGEAADGWIQITAGRLTEGDQVVIPR